jgi:hypothetical protein
MVPSEFKKFILDVNDKGARAVERIMSNFDEIEAGSTTINMRDSMDVQKCVMMSADLVPPPGSQPPGGPGQPPGPAPAMEEPIGM